MKTLTLAEWKSACSDLARKEILQANSNRNSWNRAAAIPAYTEKGKKSSTFITNVRRLPSMEVAFALGYTKPTADGLANYIAQAGGEIGFNDIRSLVANRFTSMSLGSLGMDENKDWLILNSKYFAQPIIKQKNEKHYRLYLSRYFHLIYLARQIDWEAERYVVITLMQDLTQYKMYQSGQGVNNCELLRLISDVYGVTIPMSMMSKKIRLCEILASDGIHNKRGICYSSQYEVLQAYLNSGDFAVDDLYSNDDLEDMEEAWNEAAKNEDSWGNEFASASFTEENKPLFFKENIRKAMAQPPSSILTYSP